MVLAGDDALVNRFVCAYMSIVTESPQLLIGIAIRVYVVPFEKNVLASYIARYDHWYNRHIYVPFIESNSIIPVMSTSESKYEDPPLDNVGFIDFFLFLKRIIRCFFGLHKCF
jgi:hypothetical protein